MVLEEEVPRRIEFWFDIASNYSYLSAMRIESLLAQSRIPLIWRPFLLGPIFKDNGWNTSPFALQKTKGEYVWKDTARQARKYGIAWNRPSVFPRNGLLPCRIALALADTPSIGAFVKTCMHHNFVLDREINDPALMSDILSDMGLDAKAILQYAQGEHNKLRLREQVGRAREIGIFGAPAFVVGGELFWGNDRLEDAVEFAVSPKNDSSSSAGLPLP